VGQSQQPEVRIHVARRHRLLPVQISYQGIRGWRLIQPPSSIATTLGELVDDAPIVYQTINGQRVQIKSAFRLLDNDTYTFQ